MVQSLEPYSDIRDLIEGSLEELARRRAVYPRDDLVAIRLLATLVDEAEETLKRRVGRARAKGAQWEQIAVVLGVTVTEVRLRYDGQAEHT